MNEAPRTGANHKRRLAGAALGLLMLLAHAQAHAAPARVVVARPAEADEVVGEAATRLTAELVAAGFEVVVIALKQGEDPRDQVESLALHPIATVAIVRLENRPAVDLWVSDRLTDKTLVRRLDLGKRPNNEVTSALAIHAVELLRASLLETRVQAKAPNMSLAPKIEHPVPKNVADWVDRAIEEPRKPLFEGRTVAIAAAVLQSLGGVGPAFAPALRLSLGAPSGIAGRLTILGPALSSDLHGEQGNASLRQELALAEFIYSPTRGWLAPLASVGLGAYHLHVHGSAPTNNYTAASDDKWSALADLGAGVALRLGTSAAILLDAHAFVTPARIRIGFGNGAGDPTVGSVGRPSFIASAGLQSAF